MSKLPILPGKSIIRVLEKAGFRAIRQESSHVRMKHPDGRVTTVPVHDAQDVGRGLLRKILRDAELSREEFMTLLD